MKKEVKNIAISASLYPELLEKINTYAKLREDEDGRFMAVHKVLIEMIDAYNMPDISEKDLKVIGKAISGTKLVKFHQAKVSYDGREFIVIEVVS